jgi:hypothetical protein
MPTRSRHCNGGVISDNATDLCISKIGKAADDEDPEARRPASSDNTAFTYEG